MTDLWRELARATGGDDYAHRFAARFDELAASGKDVHGEATFVASLVEPPASILDAGCGTGRVGSRLAELGYDVVGADPDEQMIAVARERSPSIEWTVAGLADMDFDTACDVVVIAGNVIPFVELEALPAAMARVAAHTKPGGLVACGFGFDEEHLPPGAPVVPLEAYDEACAGAGLELVERFAGWARQAYEGEAAGYSVSVHRRA
jgi:SAM-dependent methyltransferase